jgi:hypothetical protein
MSTLLCPRRHLAQPSADRVAVFCLSAIVCQAGHPQSQRNVELSVAVFSSTLRALKRVAQNGSFGRCFVPHCFPTSIPVDQRVGRFPGDMQTTEVVLMTPLRGPGHRFVRA